MSISLAKERISEHPPVKQKHLFPRLDYLDGLRGLAALYVVIHHAFAEIAPTGSNPALSGGLSRFLSFLWDGELAVLVFIVLSGYCLMLPVVRRGELKGGNIEFFKRRAKRILPPYYLAMVFALALDFLVPHLSSWRGARWDLTLPATTKGTLLSHVFLIHNFLPQWITKINFVFWSIAVEWQIYFVFALLLLPLWRRLGVTVTLAASVVLPLLFNTLTHHAYKTIHLHFVALFAFGMAAAVAGFADKKSKWLEKLPWGVLTFAAALLYCALLQHEPRHDWNGNIKLDFAGGASAALLLVWLTQCLLSGKERVPLLRFLQSRAMVRLGTFSYSLYLTHAVVLAILTLFLQAHSVTAMTTLLVQFFVGVPLSVAVAYGFFWFCERPFMPGKPKTEEQTAKVAVLSPAP